MKVTEDSNYVQYLGNHIVNFFSEVTNYIYVGLVVTALGLYWYNHDLWTMLRVLTTMANGFTVTFLLTEMIMTLMYKEFKRNKYITYLLIITTFTTINIVYFDKGTLYWSFLVGLIFMIPVVVVITVNKIRFWRQ